MQLVVELLEACTRTQGQQEQDLKDAKIARDVAEEHMKAVENEKEQAQRRQREMETQMKEADQEFIEAMKSMPGTLDITGKTCADSLISAIRTVAAMPNIIMGKLSVSGRPSQASHTSELSEATEK